MKYISKNLACPFNADTSLTINYKNVGLLLSYVDYFGRIKKSYFKGTTRKNQALMAKAIKKARHMGLMNFTR